MFQTRKNIATRERNRNERFSGTSLGSFRANWFSTSLAGSYRAWLFWVTREMMNSRTVNKLCNKLIKRRYKQKIKKGTERTKEKIKKQSNRIPLKRTLGQNKK